MEANGSLKPEFETDEIRSYFISRLYIHKGFLDEPKKEPKKGIERKQVILKLLSNNPAMTQAELTEELELTRKQIQSAIKELKSEGALLRKGSNRNGYWIVNKAD